MDFDNTNRGALFRNARRESEKHPDYRGTLNVGGTDYWLSAWLKTSKTGEKYLSVSVQAKDDAQPAKPSREPGSDDDAIPF
jgi:uncharacterized protein (DUF736 family)